VNDQHPLTPTSLFHKPDPALPIANFEDSGEGDSVGQRPIGRQSSSESFTLSARSELTPFVKQAPTRQELGTVTGPLVVAIERTWAAIQERHPDVPDVVLTLGNGSARPGQLTLGHFHDGKWATGDTRLPELFVGGEGLARGPRAVLGTLLHEATHGVAATRNIKDTSRQGRYHNTRFRELATELGISVERDPRIGWSITAVPDTTAGHYGDQIAALDTAIKAHRLADVHGAGRTTSNNGLVATCECEPPRKIRLSRTAYDAAAITCGACEADFTAHDTDRFTETADDGRALARDATAHSYTAQRRGNLMEDEPARRHSDDSDRRFRDDTNRQRDTATGDREDARRRADEQRRMHEHNAATTSQAVAARAQRDSVVRAASDDDASDVAIEGNGRRREDPVQRARIAVDQLVTRRREIEHQRVEATRTEHVNRWHHDDRSTSHAAQPSLADGRIDGGGVAR